MKKEKLIGLTAVAAAVVAAVAPMKAEAHHGGFWGRGGCHFWPGFIGGAVSSAIWGRPYAYPYYRTPVVYSAPVVTTPVYTQPVYTQPVYTQPVQQPVYTQPAPQPVVQAPARPAPQAQPQPVTVKVVVEHQYKTLEEVRAAVEAAKANQRQ